MIWKYWERANEFAATKAQSPPARTKIFLTCEGRFRELVAANSFACSQKLMFLCLAFCLLALAGAAFGQTAPQASGVAIVSPAPDALLESSVTTVILRFPAGQTVTLTVNGVKADRALIGRTETDSAAGTETQTWYGVVLADGVNTLAAVPASGAGDTRRVEVQSAPAKLTVRALGSHLPADGRATMTVEGTLLDSKGRPALKTALVTLTAGAGDFVGKDADPDQPGFQVRAVSGQFTATLRAGIQAQTVPIRASAGSLDAFTQVTFTTDLRPSVATGVVDLRLGSRRSDYDQPIEDFVSPDVSSGTALHGRTSVFATGKVGDYLFLGAYNSDHSLNQTANGPSSLGRDTQTSDNPYPIYGDGSSSAALAQSQDNLALRLERNQNYLMWGDYGTEEFSGPSQQLTSITRAFHAFKANFQSGAVQTTGFYGDNVQGFQRDAIAPDGTSGLYFLSHRPLVYGSESVYLELEDINRPGTVLERTAEARGADYQIDYDRGTLFFQQPVLRTDVGPDGQALVRHIIVTYQYETGSGGASVYGGRMQYHFDGGTSQGHLLGVTYLRQNQGLRQFDLSGIDTSLPLGRAGTLTAEYGHSANDSDLLGAVSGSAYRFNADMALGRGIAVTAYGRHTDTGFANDATESFVPGQTRYGGEVSAALSPTTRLRVQADHEDDKGIAPEPETTETGILIPGAAPAAGTPVNNSLQTVSVDVEQSIRKAQVSVGLTSRTRTDRIPGSGLTGSSDQLETRIAAPLRKNLTFEAQNDTSLSSGTDPVYTDRTLVGVAWKAKPGVDVRLSQQFFGRGQYSGNSVTSLEAGAERKAGDGTQMSERFTLSGGAGGMALQQSLGLGKRWALAPGLAANVGYEHVNGAFFGRTGAGSRYAQPYAVGQSASSLGVASGGSVSAGLEYTRSSDFKASARYESRSSLGGDNTVITGAVAGKVSSALTALAAYEQASSSNQLLSGLGQTATLRLGLAYRDPYRDTFNGLLHFEARRNPSVVPDTILVGSGTGSREQLFAAEGIYAPQWQWEFYGKLARRDSVSYLASDYSGSSRIDLAQARATYRFRENMDAVCDLRWIGEREAGYSSRGIVLEAGYYATPDLRLGLGYSFGRVGDRDFTGSLSSGGLFLRLTAKLNQLGGGFGLQRNALADTGAPVPSYQPVPTGNAAAPLTLPPAERAHD